MFFGLFIVLLYVATERVSWVIIGVLLFAVGAYLAYQLFGTVQTRVRCGCTCSRRRTTTTATSCASRCTGWPTAGCSAPASAAGTPSGSRCRPPTSSSRRSARRSACSGWSRCWCCTCCSSRAGIAAGLAVRDSFGKLLATGLSFLVGAAAVRRRRRRHPAAARDRPDHAVPVLRRLVAARELRHAGDPAADLGRGPAADERAARARSQLEPAMAG